MEDYHTRIYQEDRDQRIGILIRSKGDHTLTFSGMLP